MFSQVSFPGSIITLTPFTTTGQRHRVDNPVLWFPLIKPFWPELPENISTNLTLLRQARLEL